MHTSGHIPTRHLHMITSCHHFRFSFAYGPTHRPQQTQGQVVVYWPFTVPQQWQKTAASVTATPGVRIRAVETEAKAAKSKQDQQLNAKYRGKKTEESIPTYSPLRGEKMLRAPAEKKTSLVTGARTHASRLRLSSSPPTVPVHHHLHLPHPKPTPNPRVKTSHLATNRSPAQPQHAGDELASQATDRPTDGGRPGVGGGGPLQRPPPRLAPPLLLLPPFCALLLRDHGRRLLRRRRSERARPSHGGQAALRDRYASLSRTPLLL